MTGASIRAAKHTIAPIQYTGDGHGVLLLHGLSSSPLEMRFLARALHREGFTVDVPVLDGYSLDPDAPTLQRWIDAATQAYDALAARCERVSVCGLSMGATLSLALLHARSQAQALALLSTTIHYDGWAIPWYRFLLDWAYHTPLRHLWRYRESEPFGLKNEALRTKVARAMESGQLSEVGPATISMPALHTANQLARHVKRVLPTIERDCLVVHAIDDETASPKNAQMVTASIRSAFQRMIFLDDSYHMVTVDNEREIVAREIVVFLRESEAASRAGGTNAAVVSKALARRLRQLASIGK